MTARRADVLKRSGATVDVGLRCCGLAGVGLHAVAGGALAVGQ